MNDFKHLFYFFAFSIFILACSKETVVTPVATTNTGTITTTPTPTVSASGFKLTSTAVVNGVLLDAFKCEKKLNGIENSIPLAWENAPAKATSFAITMIHYPNSSDSTKYSS